MEEEILLADGTALAMGDGVWIIMQTDDRDMNQCVVLTQSDLAAMTLKST